MNHAQRVTRTTVHINDARFELAHRQPVEEIRALILAALRAGGDFVRLVVVGNRTVDVLITPQVTVVIATEDVTVDERAIGDTEEHFGLRYVDEF